MLGPMSKRRAERAATSDAHRLPDGCRPTLRRMPPNHAEETRSKPVESKRARDGSKHTRAMHIIIGDACFAMWV